MKRRTLAVALLCTGKGREAPAHRADHGVNPCCNLARDSHIQGLPEGFA
jgi:hypothetical protein